MFGKRDLLPLTLVLVGGLNWGLVAVAKFDLVAWVFGLDFGETNAASRIVYGLVGLWPSTGSAGSPPAAVRQALDQPLQPRRADALQRKDAVKEDRTPARDRRRGAGRGAPGLDRRR